MSQGPQPLPPWWRDLLAEPFFWIGLVVLAFCLRHAFR